MPRGKGLGKDFRVYLQYTDGNKKRLEEYNVQPMRATEDEPAGMDLWVGNETGREYKIVIKDVASGRRKQKEAVFVTVRIDGREVEQGRLVLSQKAFVVRTIAVHRSGVTSDYPLCFAEIQTVDDPDEADVDAEDAAEIGLISIELENGWVSRMRKKEDAWEPLEVDEVGTVYERDCKLGQMTIGGKKAIKPSSGTTYVSEGDTYGDEPFYIFNIRYAQREVIEDFLASDAQDPSSAFCTSPRESTPMDGSQDSFLLLSGPPSQDLSSSLKSSPPICKTSRSDTAFEAPALDSVEVLEDDEETELAEIRAKWGQIRAARMEKINQAPTPEYQITGRKRKAAKQKEYTVLTTTTRVIIDLAGDTTDEEDVKPSLDGQPAKRKIRQNPREVKKEY